MMYPWIALNNMIHIMLTLQIYNLYIMPCHNLNKSYEKLADQDCTSHNSCLIALNFVKPHIFKMNNNQSPPKQKPKSKTVASEWIVLAIIVVISILIVIFIYAVLEPNLFKSTSKPTSAIPTSQNKNCLKSSPPKNLKATQGLLTTPSIDVTWDPVATTSPTEERLIGYNIYLSKFANITTTIKPIFTAVVSKRLFEESSGEKIVAKTTYHYKVATVDTCGVGPLSSEEGSFTPV